MLLLPSHIVATTSTDTAWLSEWDSRHWWWWRLELVRAESWSRLRGRRRYAGNWRIAGQLVQAGCVEGGRVGGMVVTWVPMASSLSLGWSAAAGSDAWSRWLTGQGCCLPGWRDARIEKWWMKQLRGGRRCTKSRSGWNETGREWTLLVKGCQHIGLTQAAGGDGSFWLWEW